MTSSTVIEPGAQVRTESLGLAKVLRVDRAHALVELTERGGLHLKLPLERLVSMEAPRTDSPPVVPKTPAHPLGTAPPASRIRAAAADPCWKLRRALEALRFGLVPYEAVEDLTLGFDQLAAWVESRLPSAHRGRPQVAQVTGPFGTGKSHTMAVIRHVARNAGFLTAHVEVDGNSISLSDPERLLFNLWGTLRGKTFETPSPVLDLYVKAYREARGEPCVAPRGVDRIRGNFDTVGVLCRTHLLDKHGDAVEQVLISDDQVTTIEVATGLRREMSVRTQDVTLYRMIGKRVEDRPYDFLEVLIGHAQMAELAGFAGLVITVDEFEVEDNLTFGRWERVRDLLDVLRRFLSGQLQHPEAPLGIFIATVGERGHESKAVVDQMIEAGGGKTYRLPSWKDADYRELAHRIHRMYQQAYGLEDRFDGRRIDGLLDRIAANAVDNMAIIRTFIKAYLADLDIRDGPPHV